MKHVGLLFALLLALAGPAFAHPEFTNEPAGSTPRLDCGFPNATCNGELWDVYNSGFVQTNDNGPYSPSNSLQNFLAAGATEGNAQLVWPANAARALSTDRIFAGFWWRMNADFQGTVVSSNKLFFVGSQDWPQGAVGMNGLLLLYGNRDVFPWRMTWGGNTMGFDNSHICSSDSGLLCFPNVTDVPIVRNTWYKVEVYVQSSTCATCRNGIVRWWVNGILVGNYTTMNYGTGIINEIQLQSAWDGSLGYQCSGSALSRDCSRRWEHHYDHLYISTPPGGSITIPPPATPPPPTVDTTPPGQVSGVTVRQLN